MACAQDYWTAWGWGSELKNSDKVNGTDKKERVNLGLEPAKRDWRQRLNLVVAGVSYSLFSCRLIKVCYAGGGAADSGGQVFTESVRARACSWDRSPRGPPGPWLCIWGSLWVNLLDGSLGQTIRRQPARCWAARKTRQHAAPRRSSAEPTSTLFYANYPSQPNPLYLTYTRSITTLHLFVKVNRLRFSSAPSTSRFLPISADSLPSSTPTTLSKQIRFT